MARGLSLLTPILFLTQEPQDSVNSGVVGWLRAQSHLDVERSTPPNQECCWEPPPKHTLPGSCAFPLCSLGILIGGCHFWTA